MKCNDCLKKKLGYCKFTCTNPETCEDFIDESYWIHLPCKVGDMAYKLAYTECHNGETHPDSYGCCGCYDECDMHMAIKERKIPSLSFIVENFIDKCDTGYFLTYTEAEQALKKWTK